MLKSHWRVLIGKLRWIVQTNISLISIVPDQVLQQLAQLDEFARQENRLRPAQPHSGCTLSNHLVIGFDAFSTRFMTAIAVWFHSALQSSQHEDWHQPLRQGLQIEDPGRQSIIEPLVVS